MDDAEVEKRAAARVTEMADFLIMEPKFCDELKHYQHKVHEQLKYDIETHGLDFVIDILIKYRKEIMELKQPGKPKKPIRASTAS